MKSIKTWEQNPNDVQITVKKYLVVQKTWILNFKGRAFYSSNVLNSWLLAVHGVKI